MRGKGLTPGKLLSPVIYLRTQALSTWRQHQTVNMVRSGAPWSVWNIPPQLDGWRQHATGALSYSQLEPASRQGKVLRWCRPPRRVGASCSQRKIFEVGLRRRRIVNQGASLKVKR